MFHTFRGLEYDLHLGHFAYHHDRKQLVLMFERVADVPTSHFERRVTMNVDQSTDHNEGNTRSNGVFGERQHGEEEVDGVCG